MELTNHNSLSKVKIKSILHKDFHTPLMNHFERMKTNRFKENHRLDNGGKNPSGKDINALSLSIHASTYLEDTANETLEKVTLDLLLNQISLIEDLTNEHSTTITNLIKKHKSKKNTVFYSILPILITFIFGCIYYKIEPINFPMDIFSIGLLAASTVGIIVLFRN